jgi:hypothetical protein
MASQMDHSGQPKDPAYEAMWLERIKAADGLIDTADANRKIAAGRSIFLAHAYTKLLTPEGVIEPEAQSRLTTMLERFRLADYGVHCALEREGWGARLMSPETAIQLDLDQVQRADYLVSFPQGSPGAFMEMGFRVVPPKPTILVWSQSLYGENAAINYEERHYMDAMLEELAAHDVPHLLIDVPVADTGAFDNVITPQVLGWIGQQQQAAA